jgi:Transcriptional regulator, AbiEi antitoxin, Type IV TA system
VRSLFKGKRGQVLHVLLHDPKEWFGVKRLAEIAHVSPATVSETLVALERFDWLGSRGQGPSKERRLVQPATLLNEWKKQILAGPKLSIRRYYVPSASDCEKLANRLGALLAARDLEYVLTQEIAAQRCTPFLSSIARVVCRLAPERRLDGVFKELDAREVMEGTNLHIIETRSEGAFLFKERIGSVWIANPVQVYLDLLLAGGRAQEMAEHLRRERIGF